MDQGWVRKLRSVSEGDHEVSSEAIDDVGDWRLRMRDLVALHFRRTRWGMKLGRAERPGTFVRESMSAAAELSRNARYVLLVMVAGSVGDRGQPVAQERAAATRDQELQAGGQLWRRGCGRGHQQAVEREVEEERQEGSGHGRGRVRDYERGRSGSSGWLRRAQRRGLQIRSASERLGRAGPTGMPTQCDQFRLPALMVCRRRWRWAGFAAKVVSRTLGGPVAVHARACLLRFLLRSWRRRGSHCARMADATDGPGVADKHQGAALSAPHARVMAHLHHSQSRPGDSRAAPWNVWRRIIR
jgi:hypothetical protein